MGWKDWPYWVKGGIRGAVVLLIIGTFLWIAFYFIQFILMLMGFGCLGGPSYSKGFYCDLYEIIVWIFAFSDKDTFFMRGIIFYIITGFGIGLIFSLVGCIYRKITGKKK